MAPGSVVLGGDGNEALPDLLAIAMEPLDPATDLVGCDDVWAMDAAEERPAPEGWLDLVESFPARAVVDDLLPPPAVDQQVVAVEAVAVGPDVVQDSDEDQEDSLVFYCKPMKALGTAASDRAKYHVQNPMDPTRAACPSGGFIKDLVLVAADEIDLQQVCLTCRLREPRLVAWVAARAVSDDACIS